MAPQKLAAIDSRFRELAVLLVDDSPNMLRLLRTLLKALRIDTVYEAETAADALTILTEIPVDIVITDFAMQPVSGIDLVRELRTHPKSPARKVPIVMLTGHTDEELVLRARDAGVDDFLAKPVSAAMLRERLARIVTGRRAFVETPAYTGPERRTRRNLAGGPDRRRR